MTERVANLVTRSGIGEGWVSLFSKHTTAAVVINENEQLLLNDMAAMLERLSGTNKRLRPQRFQHPHRQHASRLVVQVVGVQGPNPPY